MTPKNSIPAAATSKEKVFRQHIIFGQTFSTDEQIPQGIYTEADYDKKLEHVWLHGTDPGLSTGIYNLDSNFRIVRGKLVIVTGIPSSGKSEWVDQLIVNTSHMYGWRWAIFSPENHPLDQHHIKLAEKRIGKPFKSLNPHYKDHSGWTDEDKDFSKKWAAQHLAFVYPNEENLDLDGILARIEWLSKHAGLDACVLDPWNEIEHAIPQGYTETMYIAKALGRIRRLARKYNITIFIVAHPTKLQKNAETGRYPVPTPYDIAGGAHWRNKADYCVTIHRENINLTDTDIYVQKVKFKGTGKCGKVTLYYDWVTGRYSDVNGHFEMPELGEGRLRDAKIPVVFKEEVEQEALAMDGDDMLILDGEPILTIAQEEALKAQQEQADEDAKALKMAAQLVSLVTEMAACLQERDEESPDDKRYGDVLNAVDIVLSRLK